LEQFLQDVEQSLGENKVIHCKPKKKGNLVEVNMELSSLGAMKKAKKYINDAFPNIKG